MSDDPVRDAYEAGRDHGAAVAFGLMGMAEAIRSREKSKPAPRCPVCFGSRTIWLGPPGNKYTADCYRCGR